MESVEEVHRPHEKEVYAAIAASADTTSFSNPVRPKAETTSSTLERSISSITDSIQSAIQQVGAVGDFSVFTSKELVARPPFAYFYGFVKFFARAKPSLGWAKLLSDDEMLIPQSKKEKLTFLIRLLAVVSVISQYRHDIFISPSNILCGQDVSSTHRFLKALAASTLVSDGEMFEAVKYTLDQEEAILYKRAVQTRASFRRLQALFRGWRVRKQYNAKSTVRVIEKSSESAQHHEKMCREERGKELSHHTKCDKPNESSSKTTSRTATEDLLESYQDILFRKSQVEDDLKMAEKRLKVESDRLARILKIGSTCKKESRKPSPVNPPLRTRPPFSAPSYSAVDRIANAQSNKEVPPVDEIFIDKITNLSIVERNMKKKVKVIEERERVLKQKMIRSKQKESELRLQEQRITDIADKIRRQQLQLKEQKLQFEQSKLTDTVTPPNDTARPCALCSEKEMQLRDAKDKVKHRMRLLSKREAEVIGRAQQLRAREIKLLKFQHDTIDSQRTMPCADASSRWSGSPNDDQKMANGTNRKGGGASKLHDKIAKRKRRRHEETESTPISSDAVEASFIQYCFGMSVPTIAEEPYLSLDEDDNTAEPGNCNLHPSSEIADTANETSDRNITTLISDDECLIREKEIRKEMMNAITSRTYPTLVENLSRDPSILSSSRKRQSTKSLPSPPKQHLFTFEKKGYEEKNLGKMNTRTLSVVNDNGSESPHVEGRGSRKKRHDQDDWISCFDVQMKFAENKLKELM